MASTTLQKPSIVICGGGIIGCSTAYFLSERGLSCTVVERCSIACAASGKAGGFLARDWCDTYELGPLARRSFDMHETLAGKFGNLDYRKLNTLSITTKEGGSKKKEEDIPRWVDGPVSRHYSMGTTATTAQVHPFKLTHAYMQNAVDKVGSKVLIGKVEGVEFNDNKTKVTGVKVDGKVIPADVVVIAMGPWSSQAAEWFRIPKIEAQRTHSILLRPEKPVSADAIFAEHNIKHAGLKNHEVYPRPDGDVYTCGMSDEYPLPEDPNDIEPNPHSAKKLKEFCGRLSHNLGHADMYLTQACYLPLSLDSLPLIGKIPDVDGAYIATGHSCWGILNSPGTGEAMAELIVTGTCSTVDLKPFDPARFKITSRSSKNCE